jgi:hypothetical protein
MGERKEPASREWIRTAVITTTCSYCSKATLNALLAARTLLPTGAPFLAY